MDLGIREDLTFLHSCAGGMIIAAGREKDEHWPAGQHSPGRLVHQVTFGRQDACVRT